ncbi:hypothetical protein M409DRAFT_18428 [Zasmidium cellare ATCC 36951]|uniref:Roadblock/LAMTOR2 domain-containing protein n=1 Tax=Zasmidium cellare ATCC 36951 TaxID=1080233 RepID=A0A6A6CVZ9_ZASCE|nr:uncharacterized protein M409DRAFT_18428 [Zasmidium cellare ATCC 36951]KAF2171314.1 hypothetical protein M409DRAFT_18428 [Zasmidium cellare ATCC 36951]
MLNSKALTDLLSHNRDDRLCKKWYLMTPNGTLLAYSQPTDISDIRKQAAVAAITWQEHEHQQQSGFNGEIREDAEQSPLHVLIVESQTSNIIMRKIQNHLLLVLEGGVPPRRSGFERRITAESADGTNQRPSHEDEAVSIRSDHTGSSKVATNVLKLQRTKLDQLAEAIMADFQQTGFKMPEESSTIVF